MKIAVLALQGAFAEHEKKFRDLGCDTIELREKSDLDKSFDALVLPGGESTVQGKLLHDLDMFDEIKERIQDGLPTFATCAGLILLAGNLENDPHRYFCTLPVTVRRNAYGRQLGSFFTEEDFAGMGKVPMTFIRAPYVTHAGKGVKVLAKAGDHITAVRYKNQLALSFHPELDRSSLIHRYFLDEISGT